MMEVLRWLRAPGDTLFAVGIGVLVWFVLGWITGRSYKQGERTCASKQAKDSDWRGAEAYSGD